MNNRQEQIEQAKRLIATGISKELVEVLHQQFPELKESEEERIRKALLRCCDDWDKGQFGCMAKEDVPAIRAYLERQKEKKPSSYSNLEITNVVRKALQECEGFNNYRPDVYAARVGATVESLLQEQKPTEWSEEDEKKVREIYDLLVNVCNAEIKFPKLLAWLKSLRPQQKSIISDTDKSNLKDAPAIIRKSNHPFKENIALIIEKYL